MIKKQNIFDISMFLISTVLILFVAISYYFVHININEERNAIEKEAELQELSYDLAYTSNYLTSEVRKFSVTLDPKHLRNYWKEINVTKTREHVITRLQELNTPLNEFDLLNTAKNNSDDLVNTEVRAMKLILRVYEVPDNQMEAAVREYQLTTEDENLSFNEKVNLARELLYNKTYEDNKKKIMDPIAEFDKTMINRVGMETEAARKKTNNARLVLILSIVLLSLYLIYLAWFMLYKVSIPLKRYVLSKKENNDIDGNLTDSKAISLLKELQESIQKNT